MLLKSRQGLTPIVGSLAFQPEFGQRPLNHAEVHRIVFHKKHLSREFTLGRDRRTMIQGDACRGYIQIIINLFSPQIGVAELTAFHIEHAMQNPAQRLGTQNISQHMDPEIRV